MSILFFGGLGISKKELYNDLIDNKLIRNDFISQLKQLKSVEIFTNPISNLLYYSPDVDKSLYQKKKIDLIMTTYS